MRGSVRSSGAEEVAERDRLAARLGVPMSEIAALCDRWGVAELPLFGSVLRDDFGPDSDVDVLVRFKAGRTPGLFVAARIKRELAEMFAREVDPMTRAAVEGSRNYRPTRTSRGGRSLACGIAWCMPTSTSTIRSSGRRFATNCRI